MTDTTTEVVQALARDHQWVGDAPAMYVMGHPHHWKTAAVLCALAAERDHLATAHAQMQQTLDRLARENERLREALKEADVQLAYLDDRQPTGTTPSVRSKISAALAASQPADPVTNAGCCQAPAPVTLAEALQVPEVQALIEAAKDAKLILAEHEPYPLKVCQSVIAALAAIREGEA